MTCETPGRRRSTGCAVISPPFSPTRGRNSGLVKDSTSQAEVSFASENVVGYPARPDKLGQEIEARSTVEPVDPEVSTANTTDFTANPMGELTPTSQFSEESWSCEQF